MKTSAVCFLLLAVLGVSLVAAQDCSSLAATLAGDCSDFTGAVQDNSNLQGADNSTLSGAIGSRKPSNACCNSFQNFLKASCRCNPSSESLITAAGFDDGSFGTVTKTAGIACQKQGITLKDPQYGKQCSGGKVTGGR